MKNKGSVSLLIKYIKRRWIVLLIILLSGFLISGFAIFAPKFIGYATDEIVKGTVNIGDGIININYSELIKWLLICLILYSLNLTFSVVMNEMKANYFSTITSNIRKDLFDKIHSLPISYFEKHKKGEIISYFNNDLGKIDNCITTSCNLPTTLPTLIGTILLMFIVSWQLTLIVLVLLPLIILAVKKILQISQEYHKKNQKVVADINSIVEESLSAHEIVRAYGLQENIIENLDRSLEEQRKSGYKSKFLSGVFYPIFSAIENISYVIVVFIGVFLIINDKMSIGDIQAFLLYLRTYNSIITILSGDMTFIQEGLAALDRVNTFLNEDDEVKEINNDKINFENSIVLDKVRFSYDDENVVIENVDLKINKGERIAFVGPTGGGKTTLIKLICRYYDIDIGSIKVDDIDLCNNNKHLWRDDIAIVMQDAWLFNGSIMENIRYGRLDASDEEVIKIAEICHCDKFVKKLPDGYNTVINEETSNLSQGQKQLLTIARALLKNAPIIILDEATASVDTKTERLIQDAMDKLMENRTSIIIAHRLSTIFNADCIYVIKDGKVLEKGNHKELIRFDGYYKGLYDKIAAD